MMKNPPHPGELLREDVIAELGLSVTETAERLGMSRVAFSRVLNGKAAVSPDLAIRLERAGVSTARAWLAMQTNYDLAQAMKHRMLGVQDFVQMQIIAVAHHLAEIEPGFFGTHNGFGGKRAFHGKRRKIARTGEASACIHFKGSAINS